MPTTFFSYVTGSGCYGFAVRSASLIHVNAEAVLHGPGPVCTPVLTVTLSHAPERAGDPLNPNKIQKAIYLESFVDNLGCFVGEGGGRTKRFVSFNQLIYANKLDVLSNSLPVCLPSDGGENCMSWGQGMFW